MGFFGRCYYGLQERYGGISLNQISTLHSLERDITKGIAQSFGRIFKRDFFGGTIRYVAFLAGSF